MGLGSRIERCALPPRMKCTKSIPSYIPRFTHVHHNCLDLIEPGTRKSAKENKQVFVPQYAPGRRFQAPSEQAVNMRIPTHE